MIQLPVLILDLDNTIYPVSSIGNELFEPLFDLLKKEEYGLSPETLEEAKQDVQRIPFQKVADKYNFPEELNEKALNLLRNLTYNGEIEAFDGFDAMRKYNCTRFLVTSGFTKLQQSKITKLKLENDFTGIYIIDPEVTDKTKKDVFEEIIRKYQINGEDVIVIGDDPESEIKAATDLSLRSILIDSEGQYSGSVASQNVKSLREALKDLKC